MTTGLRQPLLRSCAWRALGVEIRIAVTEPESLVPVRAVVETELAALDLACSRFRDDSELRRIDAARGAWVSVSPVLADALHVALAAAEGTDGAVDPTLGQAVRSLGYDRDFAVLPADDPRPVLVVRRFADWRAVELDRVGSRVRVPAGVQLDLGATAKAWGADRAAERAQAAVGGGVLVAFGGDIACAGTRPDGGWAVRVQDLPTPLESEPEGPAQTISLGAGGLATSSTAARRWRRGGAELHHLLDPQTGLPAASPWRTVTVAGPTCLAANVASTATVIYGRDGLDRLRDSGFAARLVSRRGEVVVVNGWPQP